MKSTMLLGLMALVSGATAPSDKVLVSRKGLEELCLHFEANVALLEADAAVGRAEAAIEGRSAEPSFRRPTISDDPCLLVTPTEIAH